MTRPLAAAAAAGAALLALAAPAQAKVWKEIYPLEPGKTATVASEGVTVTVIAPPPLPDDADTSDPDTLARYEDAAITVAFPGMEPVKIPPDPFRSAYYGISIGIAKQNPGAAQPTVFIGGYSGGAHCCGTLQLVSAIEGVPVVDALPYRDGDPVSALPKDIDGDGTLDIRWGDDSLLYQFGSYAGSWQVPRIYDLHDGFAFDVSREPRFAKLFRKFTADTLEVCRSDSFDRNGSCAGYAFGMAVLGKAEEGIATAVRYADPHGQLPEDCLADYDEDGNCPDGAEVTFEGFEQALRWAMERSGYLD